MTTTDDASPPNAAAGNDQRPPGAARYEAIALCGVGEVSSGDDLAETILKASATSGVALETGDIVVIAQKIVSKSEGRLVALNDVTPTARAIRIAKQTNKDSRLIELLLQESSRISRIGNGVVITQHRTGVTLANAGIDASNAAEGSVVLWPEDPDASARAIKHSVEEKCGVRIGVIISDSIGRPWRLGTIGHAIGVAGFAPLNNCCGRLDRAGRALQHTFVAIADEMAAAASLLMGEGDEGRPIVVLRGLGAPMSDEGAASDLLRPAEHDMYR